MTTIFSEWNCETRPGAKKALCGACGKPFILDPKKGWKGTPVVVKEEQVSWFRGDDIVTFYHPECNPELKKKREG